jgi:hypothetical protein
MPHYRINIKLEKGPVKEYIIEDGRKEIDLVYNSYKSRVYEKNGAGRVTYFDLVMIAKQSLKHLEDRKEVFHEGNDFGLNDTGTIVKPATGKKEHNLNPTLGERVRK